jgi:hypothetical protein
MIAPNYHIGEKYLKMWKDLCHFINFPIAEEKTEGPTKTLVFLGIELSSRYMHAKLPLEKLQKYCQMLSDVLPKRKITLKECQSLIGSLQFCTSVVQPGKAFIRRLIDLTIGITFPSHFVTINEESKKDIKMWYYFLKNHNGISMFNKNKTNSSDINLHTDASNKACAAVYSNMWFVIEFPISWASFNIAFLELYPIVVALEIFGSNMANQTITFHCDNLAVTQIINKQTSKDKAIMVLVRHLVLSAMKYNIIFKSQHIPGKYNILPDKLSRLQVSKHLLQEFNLHKQPVPIPSHLLPANYMSS